MKKLIGLLWTVALSTVVTTQLCAQSRAARFFKTDRLEGAYTSFIRASGVIEYFTHDAQGGRTERFLQSGVTVPGDAAVSLTASGATSLLIGGRGVGGSGRIEHYVRTEATVFALQSSVLLPGVDVSGIMIDALGGNLVVLDCVGNRVLRGAWNETVPLPQVSFVPWVTATDVPMLANSGDLELGKTGIGEVVLNAAFAYPFAYVPDYAVISSPTSQAMGAVAPHLRSVVADEASVMDGGSSIRVVGEPGTSFDVWDAESDSVLATGMIPTGLRETTVSTNARFLVGGKYAVRDTAALTYYGANLFQFECLRRAGFSEPLDAQTTLSEFNVFRRNGVQGGAEYMAQLAIRMDPAPTQYIEFTSLMLLAIGFPDQSLDPIVPYGANLLIDPAVAILVVANASVEPNTGSGGAQLILEVPFGLNGLVILGQFAFVVPTGIKLSEIGGVLVR